MKLGKALCRQSMCCYIRMESRLENCNASKYISSSPLQSIPRPLPSPLSTYPQMGGSPSLNSTQNAHQKIPKLKLTYIIGLECWHVYIRRNSVLHVNMFNRQNMASIRDGNKTEQQALAIFDSNFSRTSMSPANFQLNTRMM